MKQRADGRLLIKMSNLKVPEFESYEEEASFWDNLDTADFMEDDGEWFHFETENSLSETQERNK